MKRRFTSGGQKNSQKNKDRSRDSEKGGTQKSAASKDGPTPQKTHQKAGGKFSDRKRADEGVSSSSSSRGKDGGGGKASKSKRQIKNARSLADVIGGGGARAGSGGGSGRGAGPSRFSSGRSGPTPRPGAGGGSSSSVGDRPTSAASSKLTFITSFQEPVKSKGGTPDSRPAERPVAPTSARSPDRPPVRSSDRTPVASAKTGTPVAPPVQARTNHDFSWPTERHTPKPAGAADTGATAERKGRTPRDGARVVSGFVKRHPDGFGFLIPDDRETPDVYISRQSMSGVMTNDRVEVEIYKPRSFAKGKEDRLSGEIARIVSRANKRVVGRYLPVDHKYGVILDDNKGWGSDLRIAAADSMDAKEGDMVAVEILQYPEHNREFTGRVVTLLGDGDDPVNDVIRIVNEAGIPTEFSKQAVAIAESFGGKVTEAERKGREDLTGLDLITIDGATARDFDDAIYVEENAQGFKLIVAIADVSHYVKPGSILDNEAYDRGTSTYFPNFVVPMLPEALSNELCSLNPHVPRLCFCCEMQIDRDGDIRDFRFFEGVMESKARVTYGQAQEVMDAHADGAAASTYTASVEKFKHVADNILRAQDLAKILMAKRFRDGSLDLEVPETQVVVDSTGETVDIIRSERLFAHRLIEELMLVTNICTARFMDQAGIPGIFRIHEEPDPDAIKSLQRYLWNLGGTKSVLGGKLAKKLTEALVAMRDKPEAQILNILTLRTMQQAKYSEANVGHFGLGFSHYSHFTSPIRRYPDLIAHRLIKSELSEKYAAMAMSEEEIASATTWLSSCEQRSVKAERKVISIKKARFIRKFVGEEFDGIISSVTKFGVFVLLRQYDVDGLVKIENLGNDKFVFDDQNLRLEGARSGLAYAIGELVRVKIMNADPETGKVDFQLTTVPDTKSLKREAGDDLEFEDNGEPVFQKRRRSSAEKPVVAARRKKVKEQGRGPNTDSQQTQRGEKGRVDVSKRGKTPNNSRGVRKQRVSKRR